MVRSKIASLGLILVNLFFYQESYAQVLIFTTAYNRPDFIEMQHKTFKKFLKDDYEYRVYNDADNPAMERAIREMCEHLGIACIRVPQTLHNVDPLCHKVPASFRHGESVQFAFEHSGFKHDDIVFLIDSDEFLLHEFSVREFLGDDDAYVLFGYMKPQLCFLNMPNLNDPQKIIFRAGFEDGIFRDGGELTRHYVHAHPELKLKKGIMICGIYDIAPHGLGLDKNSDIGEQLVSRGYTRAEANLIKSIINLANETNNFYDADIGFYEKNTFLDYKHGSGWHGPQASVKGKKDKMVKDFIDSLC